MILRHPDRDKTGRMVELTGPLIRIGRDESRSNLVVADGTVSGEHARLERVGANWLLSDVGSKNGTFVNDRELEGSVILKTQDRIRFGSAILKFLSGTDIDVEAQDAIVHLVDFDALTDVHNRRHFNDRLATEVVRAKRHNRPLSVAMVDIDHFKLVNDKYGHPAGDTVLRAVARVMKERLRADDELGRLGGEEFGIVLPETDRAGSRALAEALRIAVAETRVVHGELSISVTVSIGVVEWSVEDADHDALLARCDALLYQAKRTGRNRVD